jgi:hypothetical protein
MRIAPHVGALVVCALVAAGCQTPGGQSDRNGETNGTATVPLAQAELPGFWKDYDARNNEARRVSAINPFDPREWPHVTTAARLAVERFRTAYNEADNAMVVARPLAHTNLGVFSGEFSSYPMWVLAASRETLSGYPATKAQKDAAGVYLFTKKSTGAPWLNAAVVPIDRDNLPLPFTDGDATASDADVARADHVADELVSLWETGKPPTTIAVSHDLRSLVDQVKHIRNPDIDKAWFEVERYPHMPTYAVRVAGFTLAMTTFRATLHLEARAGRQLHWTGIEAKLNGGSAQSELTLDYVATTLFRIPDHAEAAGSVVGLDIREVHTQPQPNV